SFTSRNEALAKGGLALNSDVLPVVERHNRQDWYLVSRVPLFGGTDIRDAYVALDQSGRAETEFVFTQDAARCLRENARTKAGSRLAILMDGAIVSILAGQSFTGNTGRIKGTTTREEAMDLASSLRTGPLPGRIMVLQERSIAPSAAESSLHAG